MSKTYKVIRSTNPASGTRETFVEASGLNWDDAKAVRDRLIATSTDRRSCWTRDIYYCELEREADFVDRMIAISDRKAGGSR